MLEEYTYVFAIGTMFALLEAYNNGANDVANAWATSVSSRSISYRWAMLCCLVFELTGALTVGARTASTIKGGIIDVSAFQGNAGVQLLAFACAAAGASTWVMWCTRHSAHVSSTYSLVSAIAGVGVATVGVNGVQWGWNEGQGLGAIFAGLGMAPFIAGCFGAIIFMLVKVTVHMRQNPVPWAVWTSPFFFLVAATVCTLSVVYKGSPKLGLAEKPAWYIAAVTLGTGFGVATLAAIFFVPYVHAKVIKKDSTLRWYDIFKGPANFSRPDPAEGAVAKVPNYNVVHHDEIEQDEREQAEQGIIETEHDPKKTSVTASSDDNASAEKNGTLRRRQIDPESNLPLSRNTQEDYKILLAKATERHHAELRKKRGPLGWAMRYCHHHQRGAGSIYEWHNLKVVLQRIPAQIVVAALYGANYDIHKAQVGVLGTPEGKRMDRVYAHAKKYPNEVEHLYSFVQIITACTASFAHGANDVGNSVGVWSAMYEAWSTGAPTDKKVPVKTWQIAVMALTICFGFITYGYNIMKVMGNKITYHSPSRGSSMEMGAAITTLIFSQYKLPVSTSMCITGATVGVGLCNGSFKAVNWQRVGLLMFSWIMTIPIAALIAGCIMALLLNAPHFGS